MQTPTDTYLTDETYHALKAVLAKFITVPPERWGLCDAETFIAETLGEVGGVWPKSVMTVAELGHTK